mgnify:CR=1 FL=1
MLSYVVNFLYKLLHWLLFDNFLLNSIICTQESVVNLICGNLILKCMIENVLSCWILLNSLNMSGNRNPKTLKLNCDWSQRLDHFGLVMGQTSWVLKVNKTLLNDLVNFILCDKTKILSSCDSQNFSAFLRVV